MGCCEHPGQDPDDDDREEEPCSCEEGESDDRVVNRMRVQLTIAAIGGVVSLSELIQALLPLLSG